MFVENYKSSQGTVSNLLKRRSRLRNMSDSAIGS